MYGNEQAESVERPLMRIFCGKFRSIVRESNRVDTVSIEDWRSLHLDIQVWFSFSYFIDACVLVTNTEIVLFGSTIRYTL